MGVGLYAWIALVEASLAAPAPPSPSFSEAWYRETVMGEVAAAGDLYQRIYEDGGAILARGGSLPEVHRKAAIRAGGCFEKVGRWDQAREAYSWLVRAGPADDPSVRYARIRLLSIAGGDGAPSAGAPSAAASIPPEQLPSAPAAPAVAPAPAGTPVGTPTAAAARAEGFPAVDRLRQRVDRREACSADMKIEVAKLTQRIQDEARLRRRIEDLGVELRIEIAEPVKDTKDTKDVGKEKEAAPGLIAESLRALDAEDRALLGQALAERYYLRGLRALRDRDPADAAEEFQKVLEVHPDYRDATDLLNYARGFLRPMEGMVKLAELRLAERLPERELETVRAMRAALARADLLISQDQALSALVDLERVRSEEEWPPPRVLRSAEVGALGREADLRSLLISAPPPAASASGPGVERYQELRAKGRRTIDELIDLGEDLTDLYWKSADRRRPVAPGEATPGDGSPGEGPRAVPGKEVKDDRLAKESRESLEAQRRVNEELERLLVRGEDKYRQKPQDRSQDGWRREFRDMKTLTQWFPRADKDQRFRKLAQEFLDR